MASVTTDRSTSNRSLPPSMRSCGHARIRRRKAIEPAASPFAAVHRGDGYPEDPRRRRRVEYMRPQAFAAIGIEKGKTVSMPVAEKKGQRQPLVGGPIVAKMFKYDTDPAHNPQPPR